MSLIDVVILGTVQGLTEFIPVSSSGHLLLVRELFSLDSNFAYETTLNVGTLAAAVTYFKHDLLSIVKGVFKNKNKDSNDNLLLKLILVTTVPALIFGYIVGQTFDLKDNNVVLTATALGLVGLLMITIGKKFGDKDINAMTTKSALVVGTWQLLAFIPGVSRSASTIIGGKTVGLTGEDAAKYSFIASIPVIGAAVGYTLVFESSELSGFTAMDFIVGITTAFISSTLAISFMMKFLKKHGLVSFGWYRIALATVLLLLLV